MSVLTLRRTFLAAALLLSAQALLAANPSARTGVRMVYDESAGSTVLFGGITATDAGTIQAYQLADTWLWTGARWIQRFPAHTPPGRSSHIMVYDPNRSRIVSFGGRGATSDLDDTWVYDSSDWTQISTPNAPDARSLAAAAFDRMRDRVVLFGGQHTVVSDRGIVTNAPFYDTWEFDGTTWTKTIETGPTVLLPQLVFDEAHNQVLLIGQDDQFAPLMYSYDAASRVWNRITPATLPPCVNQAGVTYQRNPGAVFLAGGVCVTSSFTSPATEEAWTWDGTNWSKAATTSAIFRVTNPAITYDEARNVTLLFGGTEAYGSPRSTTYAFDPSFAAENIAGDWVPFDTSGVIPGPRSLAAMRSDPVTKTVYLLNGLTDTLYFTDFWTYQNGGWQRIIADNTPQCGTPFASFDTDRSKLVAVCNDGSTFEWDGAAWKTFADIKTKPTFRRFAAMTYDPTQKRSVLYGGHDDTNYVDTTWLWDGTQWTEQKKNRAPARGLTAMWYDASLKKVVIYGGIGRPNVQDRLQRYNDMWALDSNGWTELKPSTLPITRYGAQVALNPANGHAILFGGLRLDIDAKGIQKQVYANDMWEWDGTNWKQLTTNNAPPARENAAMDFDFSRNNFVLFGGWSGYYLSDTWVLDGNDWRPVPESFTRRRVVGHR